MPRWTGKLKIWQKLVLICITLAVPGTVLAWMLVRDTLVIVRSTRSEISGTVYQRTLRQVLTSASRHGLLAKAAMSGGLNASSAVNTSAADVQRGLAALQGLAQSDADRFGIMQSVQRLQQSWDAMVGDARLLSPEVRYQNHAHILTSVGELIDHVTDASGLILDPEALSYFLMDVGEVKATALQRSLSDLDAWTQMLASQPERSSASVRVLDEKCDAVKTTLAALRIAVTKVAKLGDELGPELLRQFSTADAAANQLVNVAEGLRTTDGSGTTSVGPEALQSLDALQDLALRTLSSQLELRIRTAERQLLIDLLLASGLYALAGYLAYGLSRGLALGVKELTSGLERLARGEVNLGIEVDPTREFASLLGNLRTLDRVTAALARRVLQGAEGVYLAAHESARGTSDLSSRTQHQAASLRTTAAAMDQIMATVKQTADSAHEANELAIIARDRADQGGAAVAQTIQAIKDISVSSARIADIIGVIDEIAFQTNLLALNAAVEAARAGEQGRGFAVVAAEVRRLAQHSAQAAKEINDLIGDSVQKVKAGAVLADRSGKTLADIVIEIKRVSNLVSGIANANKEQAVAMNVIGDAIETIDRNTQQNAALVEQTSVASRALEEQAQGLRDAVGFFKLNPTPEAGLPANATQAFVSDGVNDRRSLSRVA